MMKTKILILLMAVAVIFSSCTEPPLTYDEEQKIIKEVDEQFMEMINLAQQEQLDEFNSLIEDDATLLTEGYYLAPDDVKAYLADIFRAIGNEDAIIKDKVFEVFNENSVYMELLSFPWETDTSHGIQLDPPPIKLYYLKESDAGMKKSLDQEAGTAVYIIPKADTSYSATIDYRKPPPIKMLGLSLIYHKNNEDWEVGKVHLSLGLKKSTVYGVNKKPLK